MKILVTGFEPFGDDTINPSWEAVSRLPRCFAGINGSDIITRRLPVSFRRGENALLCALEELHPDLVICTGLAGGRKGITIERIGINLRDARIADNDGMQPLDEPICPGGPAAYFSTLPVKNLVQALNEHQIPTSISNTAGTYVCNDILYTLLHWQAEKIPDAWGGFVHLPYTSDQAVCHGDTASGMPLDDMTRALELILQASMCMKG
ncbi:MAG: pyroglutamyl-peptidase I [Lachnospiraceae bacterium]|nr:pyroglutamyl-peptidase I [Lachnospiraceae bacterium]